MKTESVAQLTLEASSVITTNFLTSNVLALLSCNASNGRQIALYDCSRSQQISACTLQGVEALHANNVLVAACNRAQLCLWDARRCALGTPVSVIATPCPLISVSLSVDCALLAAGSDKLLSTGSQQHKHRSLGLNDSSDDEETSAQIVFYDLRFLKSDSCSSEIALLGAYSECHSDAIQALAFAPGSHDLIASGGSDGLANTFNLTQAIEDDALLQSFNCDSPVNSVGHVPKCTLVYAVTGDSKLFVWDAQSGDEALCVRDWSSVRNLQSTGGKALVDCFCTNDALYAVLNDGCDKVMLLQWRADARVQAVCDVSFDVGTRSDTARCVAWNEEAQLLCLGGDEGTVSFKRLTFDDPAPSKSIKKAKRTQRKPY